MNEALQSSHLPAKPHTSVLICLLATCQTPSLSLPPPSLPPHLIPSRLIQPFLPSEILPCCASLYLYNSPYETLTSGVCFFFTLSGRKGGEGVDENSFKSLIFCKPDCHLELENPFSSIFCFILESKKWTTD